MYVCQQCGAAMTLMNGPCGGWMWVCRVCGYSPGMSYKIENQPNTAPAAESEDAHWDLVQRFFSGASASPQSTGYGRDMEFKRRLNSTCPPQGVNYQPLSKSNDP